MNQTSASPSISSRFAAAAQTYHDESIVQRAVAEKLADSMLPPGEIERILEIGCGTGLMTEMIRRRFPMAQIHAVDIAPPMIDLARKRLGKCGQIFWHVADARQFRPEMSFPLIISSSALHWMTPISETIKRVAGLLEPGGNMVSALMVKGTLEELHSSREYLFPNKPPRLHLPSAEEALEAIAGAGLITRDSCREVIPERYDSADALLRSLNRQGVTGGSNVECRLLTRTELRKLCAYYDERFADPAGGVFASYHVLYFRAGKG